MLPDYGPSEFAAEFDVPRGTLPKLERYAALLANWQERMNLVGPATLPDIWNRHMRDSAQLAALAPRLGHRAVWLDIGAGGGFPGLVLAALDAGEIHLVESIAKKAGFLRTVADELALANAHVHNARVEALPRFRADIITARACARIEKLFDWGLPFAASSTCWLLPKGARHAEEIDEACRRFAFDFELVPSRTDSEARIVVAEKVRRR